MPWESKARGHHMVRNVRCLSFRRKEGSLVFSSVPFVMMSVKVTSSERFFSTMKVDWADWPHGTELVREGRLCRIRREPSHHRFLTR